METERRPTSPRRPSHALLAAILGGFLLFTGGCITSKVTLPPVLPVKTAVTATELVSRINAIQEVASLKTAAQLQFTDYKESSKGTGKAYPSANGFLVLQRPQRIRMQVDASLLGKLADMTSDGEHFTVAVFYPKERQSFITGTNRKLYKVDTAKMDDRDAKDVSTFAHLRPQHLSMPLLPPPIPAASGEISYSVFESLREETEPATATVPARRVTKTYYVLYVTSRRPDGQWVPQFSYWFDRTVQGTPLARLEVFEENGTLSTVSEFEDYTDKDGKMRRLPKSVRIIRPTDSYALRVIFREPEVNPESLPEEVFTLKNEDGLKAIDLDKE